LILIPVQPSPYDVWAAEEIVKIVGDVEGFKDNLKTAFVISRKITNTVIGRDVAEALSGYEVPVLKSHISQRVAFAETAGEGKTVLETEPKGSASQEIITLTNEAMELLSNG
jgi:chromosome partitioning protein